MSNEEAIKVLTEQLAYSDDVLPARLKEAYEVAIDEFKAIKEGVVFYSNRPIEDIVLEARADAIDEVKTLIQIRLIDNLCLTDATKYGNKNAEQQANSYATVMKYEIASCVDDLLDDLEQLKEKRE